MKEIVNKKHKAFESKPTNTYDAPYQSIGHTIMLDGEHRDDMIFDIEADISIADFMRKYPDKMIEENVILVKSDCRDKRVFLECSNSRYPRVTKNTCNLKVISLATDEMTNLDVRETHFLKKTDNYWITNHSYAIYVVNSFEKKQLPKRYAQMVDYTRFMVNEDLKIYLKNAIK